jgi:perosamine synthetase
MIPYGRHHIDEEDIQAVVEVLRHGALTQGPKIAEFERVIAKYTGAKYAVAVSSGTAALHLACLTADLTTGNEVVTSPNTFVASANCICYVGATPKFADIDSGTLNLDPDDLRRYCEASPSVKAIIPVHFGGLPCDMRRIRDIANEFGATVIEDASHALGATYEDGSRVGNCRFSEMTVFSFHPVKGIAAGEGGVVTTNDECRAQRLLQLRSHGICKGNFEFPGVGFFDDKLIDLENALENSELKMWYYEMQELGFNYRITDIQCALAVSQMKKVDKFLRKRRAIAATYNEEFKSFDWLRCTQLEGAEQNSRHIYVLRIDFSRIGLSRNELMKRLAEGGVGSQVHYIPVPMHPYYKSRGYSISDYPVTEKLYLETLSIPIFYDLTDEQVEKVIHAFGKI